MVRYGIIAGKVLDGHKAALIFEDLSNTTSCFGERVSGARRPSKDYVLSTAGGRNDPGFKSGEMQLSN